MENENKTVGSENVKPPTKSFAKKNAKSSLKINPPAKSPSSKTLFCLLRRYKISHREDW